MTTKRRAALHADEELRRPYFSIVVPVYNVRAYLDACITSVLQQGFRDFELILVDDCSTDGSSQMLTDYTDPRILIVRLPRNSGLGPARNAGIDAARGRYVLFLDSDDLFTSGALEAIREGIDREDEPDMLLFDYARLYWDRTQERNVLGGHITAAAAAGTFTLSERMDLLEVFNAAWSKAYRRDYVERSGLRFPSGYYEDLPWTMAALMGAERLAAIDRVVVLYRQRVSGSILRTPDRRHFEVFDQWEAVFALLRAHPEWEIYRNHLYSFMISQFDAMMNTHHRIPAEARRVFFEQATALCRRHRPETWTRSVGTGPLRATQLRITAIDRGNYTLFESTSRGKVTVDRTRAAVDRARTSLRAAAASHIGGRAQRGHRFSRRRCLDSELAVFTSYWHRQPACNPLAISMQLADQHPGIRQVWITESSARDRVPPHAEHVSPDTAEFGAVLGRAKIVVSNVNLPNWMVRRPGQVYLQTQHGTPLKLMGLDMLDRPAADRGFESWPALMGRIGQWSYCLSSNRYSSLVWERSMPGPYEMWELGYPRNDVLVTGDVERAARVRRKLGVGDRFAVLYMPTMRDYGIAPGTWLDLDRMAAQLPDSHVLLVRAHYLEDHGPIPQSPRLIDVTGHPVVEDLMLASDALLTDYSSAMFDYANTGRPIINYCSDWDAYRLVRGTYFDLSAQNPGAFVTNQDELLELLTDDARLAHLPGSREYSDFRAKFCEFDDGRAAERVVTKLLDLTEAD